jgi:hypothetical protein
MVSLLGQPDGVGEGRHRRTQQTVAALHVGPRTQEMTHTLVHTLQHALAPGCLPVFTSDGLALYFYSLTGYFGQWVHEAPARARHWRVSAQLLYGQVKKHYRRWCVERVEHRAMLGSVEQIKAALRTLGFSGRADAAPGVVPRVLHLHPHGSLRELLPTPLPLRGRVQNYRQRTPAVVAGIASRRWSVRELLTFPIPHGPRAACIARA